MFSGSIPALVTPFRDGAFDAPAFKRLVEWQIDEGTSALVPCGTTGESATIEAAAAEAPRVEIAVAEEKPVKAKRSPRTRKPKAGASGD